MKGWREWLTISVAWLAWTGGMVAAGAVSDRFLAAVGTELRTEHGHGEAVTLRGVNLGGWLVMEAWMTPMDVAGARDEWSVRATLDRRFGQAVRDELLAAYEDAWITEGDFDRVAALGCNVVRVPFWYRNVEEEDGTWRAGAFARLDWCVAQAARRGMYVVLDLHGAPGGQSGDHSTGRVRQKEKGGSGLEPDFWRNEEELRRTEEIWRWVAGHFRGNAAVAAYDLLNEPTGAPSREALWAVYDRLYRAVRAADPEHVVSMEACWGGQVAGRYVGWSWDVLPPPGRFGWTNVLYQTHAYEWDGNNVAKQRAEVDKQVIDFAAHRSWGVPGYVGEFNAMAREEAWRYALERYAAAGLSCSMWNIKATHGGGMDSWGLYNPTGAGGAEKPNLERDPADVIRAKWNRWTTAGAFAVNPMLRRVFEERREK